MFERLKLLLGPTKSREVGLRVRKTMAGIESKLISKNIKLPFAPIFIIGLPRSGTTLLYQVMTKCLKMCYFNNLTDHFPKSPVLVSLLTSPFNGNRPHGDFSSYYGETIGWNAPSQGGLIWREWCIRSHARRSARSLWRVERQAVRSHRLLSYRARWATLVAGYAGRKCLSQLRD